jgi:hypothetical protein
MNKKLVIIFLLILLMMFSSYGYAETEIIGSNVRFRCGNEYYYTNNLSIDPVQINGDEWIQFNTTRFNIDSTNPINISITYLDKNIDTVSTQDSIVLTFYADTTSGIVSFNITGLKTGSKYNLYRDGAILSRLTSDANGKISFSNYVWSIHRFDVKTSRSSSSDNPGGGGGGGSEPENDILISVLYNKKPVEDAVVEIYRYSTLVKKGETNKNGVYLTTLDEGKYTVKVIKEGFSTKTKDINVLGDVTTTVFLTESNPILIYVLVGSVIIAIVALIIVLAKKYG